jgi:hypothetical protein
MTSVMAIFVKFDLRSTLGPPVFSANYAAEGRRGHILHRRA